MGLLSRPKVKVAVKTPSASRIVSSVKRPTLMSAVRRVVKKAKPSKSSSSTSKARLQRPTKNQTSSAAKTTSKARLQRPTSTAKKSHVSSTPTKVTRSSSAKSAPASQEVEEKIRDEDYSHVNNNLPEDYPEMPSEPEEHPKRWLWILGGALGLGGAVGVIKWIRR